MLFGFGAAPAMPEGTPVTYQSGGVLFVKRYDYVPYGLAFALSHARRVNRATRRQPGLFLRNARRGTHAHDLAARLCGSKEHAT